MSYLFINHLAGFNSEKPRFGFTKRAVEELLEWKCLFFDERSPHRENVWVFDGEHMNRDAADRCSAGQDRPVHSKCSDHRSIRGWKSRMTSPEFGSVPARFGPLCRLQ